MAKTKKEKKEKKVGKRMKKRELVRALLDFFHIKQDEVLPLKYIFGQSYLTTYLLKMLCMDILSGLPDDDYTAEMDKHKYKSNNHGVEVIGTFQRKSNGKSSFTPEGGDDLIFIAERDSAHTVAGDKVYIALYAKCRGREAGDEAIEILERANDTLVGIPEVAKSYAFPVMENRMLTNDIFTLREKLKDEGTGDKAIIKVVEQPDKAKSPTGQIIDIPRKVGDNITETHAILAEFDLSHIYPTSVKKAADKIPTRIPAEKYTKRKDFRSITTFIIDPKDVKDFDDALSVHKLKDNLREVGAHIVDVARYVTEGNIIDKGVEKRAALVYLVDHTIPMFPERLCNFTCLLCLNEEELAYFAISKMTDKGEIKNSRIVHVIIKSDRCFTYEETQQIIETREGDFKKEIFKLGALAKVLRERRSAVGAINFDHYEVKLEIDEKGKPISVYFKEFKDVSKSVEELILFANRTVVEKIGHMPKSKKPKVFLYHIHDLSDLEELDNLSQFIARFDHKLCTSEVKTDVSKSINCLLDDTQGKKEENLIETVPIRAAQKARYSAHNIGHYGLSLNYYIHFTSPIHRYPDMLVYRLLTKYLGLGGRGISKQKYEAPCERSSSMEQTAANAERVSTKYKRVEYITERLGQTHGGVASDVTEWGLHVGLNENKCEGMMPIRNLDDDYYGFDEKSYCLRRRRKKRTYSFDDITTIKVARTNLEEKQLDFTLTE